MHFCKVLPSLQESVLLGFVCPQQCSFKILISTFSPMFPIHLGETILCHMYIHYKSYYFYMNPNNSYSMNNVNYKFTYPQAFIFIKQCEKRSIWKIEVYRIVLMDFSTRSSHKWKTHCPSWFVSHLKQIY